MLGKVYLIPSLIDTSMFRRHRRRSMSKRYASSVTHIPSSMSQTVMANQSAVFFASITANYATTGQILTSDTFENADRQQQSPIGADINGIVFNLGFRNATASSVIECAFFKIERANVVPVADNVLLPDNTTINNQGLQSAFRQYQPARLLKYVKVAVAAEQPRTLSVRIPYKKFRMAKVRTGDYYGVMVFNRGGELGIDFEARYKAQV